MTEQLNELICDDCYMRICCSILDEPSLDLMSFALRKCGRLLVKHFICETIRIENEGGEMTKMGDRRRTPGGIFASLLRSFLKTGQL